MGSTSKAALLSAVLLGVFSGTSHGITLVKDRVAKAAIVVPDKARRSVRYAADELNKHLKLATGTELPVLKASEAKDTRRSLVLVGPSPHTEKMGIRVDLLPAEGYVVKASGNRLALVGRDKDYRIGRRVYGDPVMYEVQTGTLYAVYAFLDKVMEVKWLWPGELGTALPKRSTLRVEDFYLVSVPQLVRRDITSSIFSRSVRTHANHFLGKRRAREMEREYRVWATRHMQGTRALTRAGHAFGHWYRKYIPKHPDWLAMYPDGERYKPKGFPHDRIKLCVSNPQVRAQVLEDGIKFLDDNPDYISFSACPNDSAAYCMCPKCKAWDDPNGPARTYRYFTREHGSTLAPHVALSDRYARFWSALAEELVKTHPDKYVFAYAYADYRTPPVSTKIHDHVIVGYVGFSYTNRHVREQSIKQWLGWADTGCRLYLRPNYLETGHGFPVLFPQRVGEDLKMCLRTGMMGTMIGWWENHWATQGLNAYVIARVLADAGRSVDAIIAEYCQAGFGRAAPAVREYFALFEKVTGRIYHSTEHRTLASAAAMWGRYFGPEVVRNAKLLLYKARMMEEDPAVQKRLDFLQKGLDYTELAGQALVKAYALSGRGEDPMGTIAAVQAKEKFYAEQLKGEWAVNVPTLRYREFSKKRASYYGLDVAEQLKGKQVFQVLMRWRFAPDRKETGLREGWHKPGFSDLAWDTLKAGEWWEPQGYGGGPDKNQIKGGYDGIAWYRAKVTVPENLKGKKITIRFGAIDESGWIWVNGRKVGEIVHHPEKNPDSWTTPVEVDISAALNYGKPTTIAVRVEDRDGAGGLWRLVSLQVVE